MRPLHRVALAMILALSLLQAGCSPESMGGGYLSGQIGRFYGDGVSFSVPLVRLAEKPGESDVYWELRQGLDSTLVVAFGPLTGSSDRFRENVVVTTEALPGPMSAAEFRAQQVKVLRQEGKIEGEPTLGEDAAGPWAEYSRTVDGQSVRCLAWFFTRESRGYVMVGSALAGTEAEDYLATFRDIAATFRFGPPPSGFALLGGAVDGVARASVAAGSGAVPAPDAATPAPGASPPPAPAAASPPPASP